jgi:PTH1 family peptidyl-tRNA hydrolase
MTKYDHYYLIGLGNPGEKYDTTRHNVGWYVLDAWRTAHGVAIPHASTQYSGRYAETTVGTTAVSVLYPDTYMNHSGSAVAKLVPKIALSQLIVVYDDIDIPFGAIKVSVGGGAAGHNGITSITQALGAPEYIRVRVGIAPRHLLTRQPVRPSGQRLPAFVLKPFTRREQQQLPAITTKAVAAIDTILAHGVTAAMNQYNAR